MPGDETMRKVDINCDMGESFGAYTIGSDEDILEFITSANIACGFHAGDPSTMRKTVQLALKKNVAIGAHPGFQDLAGFGRRNMDLTPQEIYDLVVYQIGSLAAFTASEGGRMHHVKPHGALYNMASVDRPISEAIAEAVYKVNPELILYGLSGSELVKAGERIGLKTANEVFADRTYQDDGTLTSRKNPQALITNHQSAADQVIQMVQDGTVISAAGNTVSLKADTICIHGDGTHALEFARYINARLSESGIRILSTLDVLT